MGHPSPRCPLMRHFVGLLGLVGALLAGVLIGCGTDGGQSRSSTTAEQAGVYSALDRYQHANSTGSRQDILATLTPDSPRRALLAGTDEDFALTRQRLDAAHYSETYTNRRELKINGDKATLMADFTESRSDASADGSIETRTEREILIEAHRINGVWLIHEVLSPEARQAKILEQGSK